MKKILFIPFLILVIFLISCSSFLPSANPDEEATPDQDLPSTSNQDSPAPSNLPDFFTWKTYEEPITGFSIKYPADWPVREPEPADCGRGNICEIVFGSLAQGPDDDTAISNSINVLVHSPEAIAANGGDGSSNCQNIQKVTLESGYEAEVKECSISPQGPLHIYTFKNDGWWYQIISHKGEKAAKVFDDMINSFTFTML